MQDAALRRVSPPSGRKKDITGKKKALGCSQTGIMISAKEDTERENSTCSGQ